MADKYVRDMDPAELRAHMKRLQRMNGWHDPLSDSLFAEIERLDRELERASQPGGGWNALTDEDRKAAFESLPDMLEGFMKKWGWLHFAKEIERRCYEKNQGSQTGRGEDEDGARYRFLRDECNLSVRDVFGSWCQQLNDGMDAAVDAARASLDGRRES